MVATGTDVPQVTSTSTNNKTQTLTTYTIYHMCIISIATMTAFQGTYYPFVKTTAFNVELTLHTLTNSIT